MADVGFPITMYHATNSKQVVYDAAQEKALGSEWSRFPIQQVDIDEVVFDNRRNYGSRY